MSLSKQKQIPPNTKAAHDPFAAMRYRDYRLFTIGRVLLFTGGQMQTVAIGWELYPTFRTLNCHRSKKQS